MRDDALAPVVTCGPRRPRDCRARNPRRDVVASPAGVVGGAIAGLYGAAVGQGIDSSPVLLMACLGALGGLALAHLLTWSERRTARRREETVARHSGAVWDVDHTWDRAGSTLVGAGRRRRRLLREWAPPPLAIVAFVLICVANDSLGPRWGLWLLLPPGTFAIWMILMTLRTRAIGTGRLLFGRFPYFPGERAEMTFGMDEGGTTFDAVRFILRRYEEGPEGRISARCRVTYETEFVPDPGILPGPENHVRLAFDIPADAGGTSLAARWPRYWELEVAGETTHGPYRGMFLVPVYERPAEAAS